MEGNGSLQVNHWRRKYLQYRIVIKLKNTPANKGMLQTIEKKIGGRVREEQEKLRVVWVVDDREEVKRVIKIYEEYPPLTTKSELEIK